MANNPALQLLMVTTLKGFPFHWQWGKDNILMVSVGTGKSKWSKIPKAVMKSHILTWASQIPDMFMQDASWQNQMVMQWLSYSPTAWEIDGEVGSLAKNLIAGKRESDGGYLTYFRYNMWLDNASLQPLMGKSYTQEQINGLTEMSNEESRFEGSAERSFSRPFFRKIQN